MAAPDEPPNCPRTVPRKVTHARDIPHSPERVHWQRESDSGGATGATSGFWRALELALASPQALELIEAPQELSPFLAPHAHELTPELTPELAPDAAREGQRCSQALHGETAADAEAVSRAADSRRARLRLRKFDSRAGRLRLRLRSSRRP